MHCDNLRTYTSLWDVQIVKYLITVIYQNRNLFQYSYAIKEVFFEIQRYILYQQSKLKENQKQPKETAINHVFQLHWHYKIQFVIGFGKMFFDDFCLLL